MTNSSLANLGPRTQESDRTRQSEPEQQTQESSVHNKANRNNKPRTQESERTRQCKPKQQTQDTGVRGTRNTKPEQQTQDTGVRRHKKKRTGAKKPGHRSPTEQDKALEQQSQDPGVRPHKTMEKNNKPRTQESDRYGTVYCACRYYSTPFYTIPFYARLRPDPGCLGLLSQDVLHQDDLNSAGGEERVASCFCGCRA